jgi:hypothetical protein
MVIIEFFAWFGTYFSHKMFIASVAKNLYLLKKPDYVEELDDDKNL